MTEPTVRPPTYPPALSTPRLLLAIGSALLVAAMLLLVWILPAEYGFDPTGLGKRLGLTALNSEQVAAHSTQASALAKDEITFELSPFASVEYKYLLSQDAALVYSWQATGEVVFDFHAEPDGGGKDDEVSFAMGRDTNGRGTYHASFTGIHGWFWENRGTETVTVRLSTAGFAAQALHYEGGFINERALQPVH